MSTGPTPAGASPTGVRVPVVAGGASVRVGVCARREFVFHSLGNATLDLVRLLFRLLHAAEHRHAVQDHDESRPDVCDDSFPESGVSHEREDQHDTLGDDRERDVLADLYEAHVTDGDGLRHPGEVVGEERHVSRLHRRRGPGDSHGDADIRGAQGGCVVDAVANHGEGTPADETASEGLGTARGGFELGHAAHNLLHLPGRGHSRHDVPSGDIARLRDAKCAALVVSREHDHLRAPLAERRDRPWGRGAQSILAPQRSGAVALHADPQSGGAGPLPLGGGGGERGIVASPAPPPRESGTADFDELAVYPRARALAREGLEFGHLALLGGDANSRAAAREHGGGDGVRSPQFERARPTQQRAGS
mmetsp:Transcript_13140/g.59318  ORF Transcript_13140/g.59318 Transcript_13140/m.59318 type:complete len:364 (-) Transcript_13140:2173-3264(-)